MKALIKYGFIVGLMIFSGRLPAQEIIAEMVDFIKQKAKGPENYVVETFQNHDVVFLAENHIVKQNLLFVQGLIPRLYENGIYTLGMEFGACEVQDKLDQLVTDENYDEALANEIMFTYNVAWGYKEYVDVYKAAWKLNRSLPEDARKFRILNLSYIFKWEKFTGVRNQESMKLVFDKGTIDKFRAEMIEKEIINKNEKIFALVGTSHAYTRYGSPFYKYNGDNFCDFDFDWLGNRLYKKYPERVFSIILHQAFTKKENDMYSPVSPADGAVERLMAQNGNKPAGFDLIDTPAGKLPDRSINSVCYENFTLEQLFDGYIFLEPLKNLEGCTVIDNFVNEENIGQALKNFPDPDWQERPKTLDDLKRIIKDRSDRVSLQNRDL